MKIIPFIIGFILGLLIYRYIIKRWFYWMGYMSHEGWCKVMGHKKPPLLRPYLVTHYTCLRCHRIISNTDDDGYAKPL